jgi:hypothetical protein
VSLLDSTFVAGIEPELEVLVLTGQAALNGHAQQLETLAASVPGTPITARWPWAAVSVVEPPAGHTPWLVGVRAGDELIAAALLLDDDTGSVRRTSLAGTEEGHRGALLAVSEPAAVQLGTALGHSLMSQLREFTLGPVPRGPAVDALLDHLPVGLVVDDAAIPVVRRSATLGLGMSRGTVRTLRKARNRMAADEVRSEILVTDDRHVITGMLPLLESISRDRDYAAGRASPLDDLDQRRRWERRVRALAIDGSLRLATLLLNGELAAYLFGVVDGTTYRVLEGRYVATWARYAPGRVLEAAVLEDVIDSTQFETFDWMTTVAPDSLLAANDVDPHIVIRGRSSAR